MLRSLTIQNYSLIQGLEMQLNPELNILTGETGAGKSIILGALGLLMGQRVDTKVLFNRDKKCIVEGIFNFRSTRLTKLLKHLDLDNEDELILRREINSSGKSRAFVNDTPILLDDLKRVSREILDIHSQHESLHLHSGSYQLDIIDTIAENELQLDAYQKAFASYKAEVKAYESLKQEAMELRKEQEFNQFQFDELAKVDLQNIDETSLTEELNQLDNADQIKAILSKSNYLLDEEEASILAKLAEIKQETNGLNGMGRSFEELTERLKSVTIELQDISDEIQNLNSKVESDPEKTEIIRGQLDSLQRLQHKHSLTTIEELLVLKNDLDEKLHITGNLETQLEKSQTDLTQCKTKLDTAAKALSASRKKVFKTFCKNTKDILIELGIPKAQISIDHKLSTASSKGADLIDILFSANQGIEPGPLKKVASGGEFSRLMFAIKHQLADKHKMPTLVFDEIDTGISGEIALKLAGLMKKMAQKHQVICITHLPQMASAGNAHFKVYKSQEGNLAQTKVIQLDKESRIKEVAEMISGSQTSETALQSARELLKDSITAS